MDQAAAARRRVFAAGTLLFAEGDAGDAAYIVESGRVSVFKTVKGRRVTLGEIGPGGIFGEMALIDDQPRMASALVTPAITKQPIAKAAVSLEDMRILHQSNCLG